MAISQIFMFQMFFLFTNFFKESFSIFHFMFFSTLLVKQILKIKIMDCRLLLPGYRPLTYQKNQLRYTKLRKEALPPVFASTGAAGADLHSVEECVVPAKGKYLVSTGIRIALPEGYYGRFIFETYSESEIDYHAAALIQTNEFNKSVIDSIATVTESKATVTIFGLAVGCLAVILAVFALGYFFLVAVIDRGFAQIIAQLPSVIQNCTQKQSLFDIEHGNRNILQKPNSTSNGGKDNKTDMKLSDLLAKEQIDKETTKEPKNDVNPLDNTLLNQIIKHWNDLKKRILDKFKTDVRLTLQSTFCI
ncbi:dUTPase domain-containing protein [Meloidogyne graminicola]|uniref:dUTP diphosphatase n=1 Tax=Meloidogyne graminicola TaxID=189291 RepID=A0A8S9ZUM8_9BILA|nr:dUTPase domain-containing protein [Meloidogyne graminicola]